MKPMSPLTYALLGLTRYLKRNRITHAEGYAFDEGWVERTVAYLRKETAAWSLNYEVILHFEDHEPVDAILTVSRDGTYKLTTVH